MKNYSILIALTLPLSGCMTTEGGQAMIAGFQQQAQYNEDRARENTARTYQRYDKAMENYRNGFKQTPSYTVTDEKGRTYVVTPR